jgi:hypothetical protein
VAASPHSSAALPVLAAIIALGDHSAAIFDGQQEDIFGVRVAAADWDADGQTDVLATARASDGPEGTREDAGQAYVIPIGPRLQ